MQELGVDVADGARDIGLGGIEETGQDRADGEGGRHVRGQRDVDLAGVVARSAARCQDGGLEGGLARRGYAGREREHVGEPGRLRLVAAQRAHREPRRDIRPARLGQGDPVDDQERDCLVVGIEGPAAGLGDGGLDHGQ